MQNKDIKASQIPQMALTHAFLSACWNIRLIAPND